MNIKIVVHEAEGGFWAEAPALPGCASQDESLDELMANMREAIEGWLAADVPAPLVPRPRSGAERGRGTAQRWRGPPPRCGLPPWTLGASPERPHRASPPPPPSVVPLTGTKHEHMVPLTAGESVHDHHVRAGSGGVGGGERDGVGGLHPLRPGRLSGADRYA